METLCFLSPRLHHACAPSAFSRPPVTGVCGANFQVDYVAPTSLRRGLGIRPYSAVSNPSTRMKVTAGKIRSDVFVREGQRDTG